MNKKIVLASNSQRRKDLLKQIGIEFETLSPDVDEVLLKNPKKTVLINSRRKALSGKNKYPDAIVIGVDTVIYFKNKIIGKPENKEASLNILKQLNNNRHYVYSGITVVYKDKIISNYSKTEVFFDKVNEKYLEEYVNKYNPIDKAGGYGIQEFAGVFVKKIKGDYFNIVGLPLNLLFRMFSKFFSEIGD